MRRNVARLHVVHSVDMIIVLCCVHEYDIDMIHLTEVLRMKTILVSQVMIVHSTSWDKDQDSEECTICPSPSLTQMANELRFL